MTTTLPNGLIIRSAEQKSFGPRKCLICQSVTRPGFDHCDKCIEESTPIPPPYSPQLSSVDRHTNYVNALRECEGLDEVNEIRELWGKREWSESEYADYCQALSELEF